MRLTRPDHLPTIHSEVELLTPDGLWATLSVAGVAVAVLAPDLTIEWCNPAFADLAERTPGEIVSETVVDGLGVERADKVRHALVTAGRGDAPLHRFEAETVDWAGTKRTLALSASLTSTWSEPGRLVVVAENVTSERRGQAQRLGSAIDAARRASEDGLTGLPNRVTFEALLESSLRRVARNITSVAVMSCNLDGFHVVNERLGDAAGDYLLQGVATRLTHTLRHHDLLARFSGDEFIVVAEEVADDAMAHQVARRLAAAISEPIDVDGVDVRIGVSIGFTIAQGHERPSDLLAEAERAMQGAKRAGKGRSMSFDQVIAGSHESGPTAIDWNELSLAGPVESAE